MDNRALFWPLALALVGCQKAHPPAHEWTTKQQKVVAIADEFLRNHGSAWGEAVGVEALGEKTANHLGEAGEGYRVHYETPEREAKVLGGRAVLVNLTTGKVVYQPRE